MSLDPNEETSIATPIDTTHEGFPNDPLWNKQWNFRQIGIPEAWKLAQGRFCWDVEKEILVDCVRRVLPLQK